MPSAGSWDSLAVIVRVMATVVAVTINTAVCVLAFRVLTAHHIDLRDLRDGAIAAGIAWQALQELGTNVFGREPRGLNAAYGLSGIVLGLLAWICLGAFIIVFAAEVSVVRAHRL